MYLGLFPPGIDPHGFWERTYGLLGALPADQLQKIYRHSPVHVLASAHLSKGGRILDAGCGIGILSLIHPDPHCTIIGIDSAIQQITKARELSPGHTFEVASLDKVPYPDQTFDGYAAISSAELFPGGLEPVVREAYRLLKPGGRFFMASPRLQPDFFLTRRRTITFTMGSLDVVKVTAPPHPFPERGYGYWYSAGEIREIVKQTGFKTITTTRSDLMGGLCYSHLLGRLLKNPLSQFSQQLMEHPPGRAASWKDRIGFALLSEESADLGRWQPLLNLLKLAWSFWNVTEAQR